MRDFAEEMRQKDEAKRDPQSLLYQADAWATNAERFVERGDDERQTAAVFAQIALARAVSALAAAQLKTAEALAGK